MLLALVPSRPTSLDLFMRMLGVIDYRLDWLCVDPPERPLLRKLISDSPLWLNVFVDSAIIPFSGDFGLSFPASVARFDIV